MKLGISLYSYHSYAADDSLGLKGCIDNAKALGAEGVDIVEDWGRIGDVEAYKEYARDIGAYLKEKEMEALCFCVGADFVNNDFDAEVARVKVLVDLAECFGCKMIRHDATNGYNNEIKTKRGFDDVLPIIAKGYREITEYAEAKGIRTCVENHGRFVQDADRVEKLINAVGHKNFGALVDIGNFASADGDHAYSVGLLAPYAFHVHAKDFHKKSGALDFPGEGWFPSRANNWLRGAIIGHGDVPVRQCLNILKNNGYDGYCVVEFEGLEDPLYGVRVGFENLKRFAE